MLVHKRMQVRLLGSVWVCWVCAKKKKLINNDTKMENETEADTASALVFLKFYFIIIFFVLRGSTHFVRMHSVLLPILLLIFPRKPLVLQRIAKTIGLLLQLINAESFMIFPSNATYLFWLHWQLALSIFKLSTKFHANAAFHSILLRPHNT